MKLAAIGSSFSDCISEEEICISAVKMGEYSRPKLSSNPFVCIFNSVKIYIPINFKNKKIKKFTHFICGVPYILILYYLIHIY